MARTGRGVGVAVFTFGLLVGAARPGYAWWERVTLNTQPIPNEVTTPSAVVRVPNRSDSPAASITAVTVRGYADAGGLPGPGLGYHNGLYVTACVRAFASAAGTCTPVRVVDLTAPGAFSYNMVSADIAQWQTMGYPYLIVVLERGNFSGVSFSGD